MVFHELLENVLTLSQRCNAAWQGIPCSNCVEDNVPCEIYRRGTDVYEPNAYSSDFTV